MRNEEFEQILKQALENRAKEITASPYLLEKVKLEAEARGRKERKFMGISKKIAVAAAICVMSVTAYAAVSNLAGISSHSTNDIKTFAQLEKAEDKLGFDISLPDTLSNGMTFSDGGTGEEYGWDENGNRLDKTYKMLTAAYKDGDGNSISLHVTEGDPRVDAGEKAPEGYSTMTNKFLPPDYEGEYELTEEEIALQEAGKLNIAYGSSEVEVMQSESYYWEADGLYYCLIGFDLNLGEEAFAQMAADIMK